MTELIQDPGDAALGDLCTQLQAMATQLDVEDAWVGRQLELCALRRVSLVLAGRARGLRVD